MFPKKAFGMITEQGVNFMVPNELLVKSAKSVAFMTGCLLSCIFITFLPIDGDIGHRQFNEHISFTNNHDPGSMRFPIDLIRSGCRSQKYINSPQQ